MPQTKENGTTAKSFGHINRIVGFAFSALAMIIFVYVFVIEEQAEIRSQAIYWFLLSLASAFLPSIQQMKYGDLELSFLKISSEMSEIKKQVNSIEEKFFQGADWYNSWHETLTEEQIKERSESHKRFAERLWRSSEKERLFEQERVTRLCLFELCLTISAVKSALAETGYFGGAIDDVFTAEFADSIATFQRENGVESVDGVYGGLTHRVLASLLKKKQRVSVASNV